MLVSLFTVLAVTSNIVFVWPQAFRLLRSRTLDGVAPATWTISVVLFSVWAVFALRTEYWALLIANASCLVAAVLIMIVGTRKGWPARWAAVCVVAMALAFVAGVFAPLVLAFVMIGAGVALRIPQLLMLLRAPSTAGVSATTWVLSAATAGSWLIVSMSNGATVVVVANSCALAATVVLLVVLAIRRRSDTADVLT